MRHLTITACSDRGMVRGKNEDTALLNNRPLRDDTLATEAVLSPESRYILAVCDGMGGHNAGEVASRHVAINLARGFNALPDGLKENELKKQMELWHGQEHRLLNEAGEQNEQYHGMGSTLVGLLFYGNTVAWFNCGDSRLYRFRDGILSQVSADHSLYAITENPDDKHIITNCMGTGEQCNSYLDYRDITDHVLDGDTFLLCSDGLTDMLTDDEIENMLNLGSGAKSLVDAACIAGGHDNVTVVKVTFNT